LKDQKHAHYIHDGNAIGFTLDSMGGSQMQPQTSLITYTPRAQAHVNADGIQMV